LVGEFDSGHFTTDNCPPPKTIYLPAKITTDDCCEKCEDLCASTNCADVQCGEPQLPLCAAVKPGKKDPYACCNQCLSACPPEKVLQCPPAPTEAECTAMVPLLLLLRLLVEN
jgi:hypothetical protein